MLILGRVVIWISETAVEGFLLGCVLVTLVGGCRSDPLYHCLSSSFVAVAISFFFATGYLLTTFIARMIWRGRSVWAYSVLATALFLAHFEVVSRSQGVELTPMVGAVIRIAGGCIIFAATVVGTLVLRRLPSRSGRPWVRT